MTKAGPGCMHEIHWRPLHTLLASTKYDPLGGLALSPNLDDTSGTLHLLDLLKCIQPREKDRVFDSEEYSTRWERWDDGDERSWV